MKTNYKQRWSLFIFLLAILINGCSTDDIVNNETGSSKRETEKYIISTFSLPKGDSEHVLTDGESIFVLRSLSDNSTQMFEGMLKNQEEKLLCDMYLPHNERLEDGDYILNLKTSKEGHAYPISYHLTFLDQMVGQILEINTPYNKLEGKGTEKDPYKISSTDDFAYFVSQLQQYDSSYGYGKYFVQTSDIMAPRTDCLYQGNIYKSAPFAGYYDGNSSEIKNLIYVGDSKLPDDNPVGLFTILYSGAVIKNLKITGANIHMPGSSCGLLAGEAYGNIHIENVTLTGEIEKGMQKIGGLIGYMGGSDNNRGELNLNNITFRVTLSDNQQYVGGLIGWAENVNVTINKATSTPFEPIKAESNVGGLAGKIHGQIKANDIHLEHSTNSAIHFNGNTNTGGLIGELSLLGSSSFQDITVNLAIEGNDNVGGLIGRLSSAANEQLTVTISGYNAPLGSYIIKGHNNIGGIIGLSEPSKENALTLRLQGKSLLTANISANAYAGGAFGYLLNTSIQFDASSLLTIKSPSITVQNEACGGYIGYANNCNTLDLNSIRIDEAIDISGMLYIGGIVGYIKYGTIKGNYTPTFSNTQAITSPIPSPTFAGKINDRNYQSARLIGGIVGGAEYAFLKNLFAAPSIYGNDVIGGIIGEARYTEITNCGSKIMHFNSSSIQGSTLGGIAGYLTCDNQKYENLVNYTNIPSGTASTGGIFGHMYILSNATITKAVNLAGITASNSVGGIVGRTLGKGFLHIHQSANFGEINASSTTTKEELGVGGIVGHAENTTSVYYSVNHGEIKIGTNSAYHGVGGILGYSEHSGVQIRYCCNRANIEFYREKENHGIGGIVGEAGKASKDNNSHILDCYNLGSNMGQLKTVSTDYRGGIAGSLGQHTRCYRSINVGQIFLGNGGVGTTDLLSRDLNHIYVLYGTGKEWGSTYIYDSNKSNESTYQGFDFNGSGDTKNQPTWVLDAKSNSDNQGIPHIYPDKCYFQFAEYTP